MNIIQAEWGVGTSILSVREAIDLGAYRSPFVGALPFNAPPWDGSVDHYSGVYSADGDLVDKTPRFGYIVYLWNRWKNNLTLAQRNAEISKTMDQLSQ